MDEQNTTRLNAEHPQALYGANFLLHRVRLSRVSPCTSGHSPRTTCATRAATIPALHPVKPRGHTHTVAIFENVACEQNTKSFKLTTMSGAEVKGE